MKIPRTRLQLCRTLFPQALIVCAHCFLIACPRTAADLITCTVDPKAREVRMYWKDDEGRPFKTFENLKTRLADKGRELVFAVNGGIFDSSREPLGLFIENYETKKPLNRTAGSGNFYMQPNGVFYLTRRNEAVVCAADAFPGPADVAFATQSGPMLVIDGERNPQFTEGSDNRFVRNGVGILGDGRILFVMSTAEVNFYDFAGCFLEQGCRNALYLDGFISQTWRDGKNLTPPDREFSVIIAVASEK